ncbi:hypothetical protein IMSHALPRED_003834 [Imshaugia aleurites]|uniref:Uncharacterized protein n=1 Tax=Imshaugia aleurites TaxID=172621 RepID=A0A8H3IEQ2_9LECA|nr:hypothetical protein IMSHALPRED_003834 [Imshaugia aleurites]
MISGGVETGSQDLQQQLDTATVELELGGGVEIGSQDLQQQQQLDTVMVDPGLGGWAEAGSQDSQQEVFDITIGGASASEDQHREGVDQERAALASNVRFFGIFPIDF